MTERPAIVAIEQDADGDDVRVTITLDYADQKHYGQAIGRSDAPHRPRLAVEAALHAVESLSGNALDLELLAIATAALGEARIALAQIRLGGTPEAILVGSALIREDDPPLAAVRAVMDALNRRLGSLI